MGFSETDWDNRRFGLAALRCARRAERVGAELDRGVQAFALSAFGARFEPAERQIERLSDLLARRDRAKLLAERVSRTLAMLERKEAGVLRSKFLHRRSSKEIAASLGVSVRTAQRRVSAAESAFVFRFERSGFCEGAEAFLRESWFE